MNNVLYEKVITPASYERDGELGDYSPTKVIVTQEVNCFAVWMEGEGYSGHLLYIDLNKDRAIEEGVDLAQLPEKDLAMMGLAPSAGGTPCK